MAITFNTNVSALTSQRYLGISADKTASSLAKLSSGSRVPTAKDDAAALAVGSKLRAEVAGLNTAANNASQAISLLQIADGALSTTGDILVRMKALAVQSSSGQLADAERSLLNQEFTNLRSEIDRIAQITNFNGNTLLNGGDVVAAQTEGKTGGLDGRGITLTANTGVTSDDSVFLVQYNHTDNTTDNDGTSQSDVGQLTVTNLTSGESQTVNIAAAFLAASGEAVDADADGTNFDTTLTQNLGVGTTVDVNFGALGVSLKLDSDFDVDADYNVALAPHSSTTLQDAVEDDVTATYLNGGLDSLSGDDFATLIGGPLDASTGLLTINVGDDVDDTLDIDATTGLEFSADGVTYTATLAGLTVDGATDNSIYVRAAGATGAFARVDIAAAADVVGSSGASNNTLVIDLSAGGLVRVQEVASAAKSFDFKVGTGVSVNDNVAFSLSATTTSALGISDASIGTATGANDAITAINGAIDTVASRRADIGANQSRLDFAGASIAVAIENTTAAQSGLLDVDVSAEITEFTSQQVLLQAGVSLLAQANQQPALLLRLLQ